MSFYINCVTVFKPFHRPSAREKSPPGKRSRLRLAFTEFPYYLTKSIVDLTESAVTDAVPNSRMASLLCEGLRPFCIDGNPSAVEIPTPIARIGSRPPASARALNLIEMVMENNTFFVTVQRVAKSDALQTANCKCLQGAAPVK